VGLRRGLRTRPTSGGEASEQRLGRTIIGGGLPRGRIRPWLDGGRPDCYRGLRHDCPVKEKQQRREAALERLKDEQGLEIGDSCRLLKTGREVEIVDIEPSEAAEELTVVWVPAGREDTDESRRRSTASELV
jgi:hypothetical protein